MWIPVLSVLGIIILGIVAFAAMKPNEFKIERAITINTSPEPIFDVLSDFHQSIHWSPWDKIDPHAKMVISGAPRGVGAVYEWDGNKQVGAGRQEIIAVDPPRLVATQIDFFRPFQSRNHVEFTMTPDGAGTRVNWAMTGPQPLLGRIVCLFMNMDKMVGKDFEKGLASLKAHLEGTPKAE